MKDWVKMNGLKSGDVIVADNSFSCMKKGPMRVAAGSMGHLYVECSKGKHYLNGQLNSDGELVGFTLP